MRQPTGIGPIEVQKSELKAILLKNREAHRGIYEKAIAVYRARVTQELDDFLRRIERGEVIRIWSVHPVPEEHTADYDRVIGMLDMAVGGTITLSEQAYAQYVDDDWGWKDSFSANTASYLGDAL